MAKAAAAAAGVVEIPKMTITKIALKVVGTSPLLSHKWSQEQRDAMLNKQMKVPSTGRAAKNPFNDFINSLYWLDTDDNNPPDGINEQNWQEVVENHRFAFPANGFKQSAVSACRSLDAKMTAMRGAFHVLGNLVEIFGKPVMDEAMVRIAMGTSDIRFRGRFDKWHAVLPIAYNAGFITPAQIANLFNVAGFAVGVGDWRPEKDGSYGMFEVQ